MATASALKVAQEMSDVLWNNFHPQSIRLFGSLARNQETSESDIDLLVEFGPLEITKRFHVFLEAREA